MIKPARGIILVEAIKDTEKTAGGVYLPESAKDKPMKGKIIAVSKLGTKDYAWQDIEARENDIIYYKKWGNEEVKKDGKDYVFVRFEDVLGVET